MCMCYICTFVGRAGAGTADGGNVGVSVGGAVGRANYPGGGGGGSSGGSYDLDDFEDESAIQERQDYAYLVRSRLASEHKQKSNVAGFEVSYSNMYAIYIHLFTGISQHLFVVRYSA